MKFWYRLVARAAAIKYRYFFKPLFFLQDPETIHDRMVRFGSLLGKSALARALLRGLFGYGHPSLKQTVAGIEFKNPVGLAAGFDKDAYLTRILPSVGFGFEEIGSITGEPCAGNPKPWLWRLPKSQSLVVYYGLKNQGAEAIAGRLYGQKFAFPLGVSLAKTNSADTVEEEKGIADYAKVYKTFLEKNIGDYFTVNISCPNAFGGEPFVEPEKLDRLLAALKALNSGKPMFVKLPADIGTERLEEITSVSRRHGITGFICSNLTKNRNNPKIKETDLPDRGGLSGKVVRDLSDGLIRQIYSRCGKEFVIIGCGGVFNAEDAYKKIRLGASLVQLVTGLIYQGPQLVSQINQDLVRLLERDGFGNIAEAVGADFR